MSEPRPTSETPDGSATPSIEVKELQPIENEIKTEEVKLITFLKKQLPVIISFIIGLISGCILTLVL